MHLGEDEEHCTREGKRKGGRGEEQITQSSSITPTQEAYP